MKSGEVIGQKWAMFVSRVKINYLQVVSHITYCGYLPPNYRNALTAANDGTGSCICCRQSEGNETKLFGRSIRRTREDV